MQSTDWLRWNLLHRSYRFDFIFFLVDRRYGNGAELSHVLGVLRDQYLLWNGGQDLLADITNAVQRILVFRLNESPVQDECHLAVGTVAVEKRQVARLALESVLLFDSHAPAHVDGFICFASDFLRVVGRIYHSRAVPLPQRQFIYAAV